MAERGRVWETCLTTVIIFAVQSDDRNDRIYIYI